MENKSFKHTYLIIDLFYILCHLFRLSWTKLKIDNVDKCQWTIYSKMIFNLSPAELCMKLYSS